MNRRAVRFAMGATFVGAVLALYPGQAWAPFSDLFKNLPPPGSVLTVPKAWGGWSA